jgi:hypothetical protein
MAPINVKGSDINVKNLLFINDYGFVQRIQLF